MHTYTRRYTNTHVYGYTLVYFTNTREFANSHGFVYMYTTYTCVFYEYARVRAARIPSAAAEVPHMVPHKEEPLPPLASEGDFFKKKFNKVYIDPFFVDLFFLY